MNGAKVKILVLGRGDKEAKLCELIEDARDRGMNEEPPKCSQQNKELREDQNAWKKEFRTFAGVFLYWEGESDSSLIKQLRPWKDRLAVFGGKFNETESALEGIGIRKGDVFVFVHPPELGTVRRAINAVGTQPTATLKIASWQAALKILGATTGPIGVLAGLVKDLGPWWMIYAGAAVFIVAVVAIVIGWLRRSKSNPPAR